MIRSRARTVLIGGCAALLFLIALSARPVHAAPGREVFRAHVLRGTTVRTPKATLPVSSGDVTGSVDLDFSPEQTLASRARSGAISVTLGTPITYTIKATLSVPLPNLTTGETFTATLDLQTGHGHTCKAPTVSGTGNAGGSITLTSTVQCSDSVVYFYFFSYASPFVTRGSLSYTGNKGHAGGGSFDATTVYEFLEDEMSLYSESPSRGTTLATGTKRTFSATAQVSLQTKPKGDLALRLFDQKGDLQGSSDFLSIPRDDVGTGVAYNLEMKDVPIEKHVTQLTLRAVVIDPASARVLMHSDDTLYPLRARCSLEGVAKREADGKTYWLPDALVDILDGDKAVVAAVKAKPDPDDASVQSWFCFQLPASFDDKKDYTLRVRLQDNATLTSGRLAVFPNLGVDQNDEKPDPLAIKSMPFRIHNGAPNKQDILVNAAALGLSGLAGEKAEAGAEAYWHLYRQVTRMTGFFPPGFALTDGRPVRVYLNRENLKWACPTLGASVRSCYCGSGSNCPAVYSIVLGEGPSMPGAHASSLFHEFGHHVGHQLWESANGPPRPGDDDRGEGSHAGYYNNWTSDSMDEGFATFWAVHSNRFLDGDTSSVYQWNDPTPKRGIGLPMEHNFAAWDYRRPDASATAPAGAVEDLAFAGLLQDIVDTTDDTEPAPDVSFTNGATRYVPSDTVTWDVKSILTLIKDTKPGTILKLHDDLAARMPGELTSPAGNPRGSGLSQLDELFVMHRMFHDAAPANFQFDFGEKVGKTANGAAYLGGLRTDPVPARPLREEPPTIPGSFLDLRFVTDAGQAAEGSTVTVEERFGLGFEQFDRTVQVPILGGKVYFPMPPPQYPVQVSLKIPGRGEAPKVFDNATYEANVGRGETFFSGTFVVPPPPPETTAVVPPRAAPGSTVRIAGKAFARPAGLNTVRFGNATASVASATATELVVTVPSSLRDGTAPLTVATAAGTSAPLEFTAVTAVASLSPGSYEYGAAYVGDTQEAAFTLKNVGLADLRVLGAASTDPAFSLASPRAPFTLEPGATQEVKLAFRPRREAPASGTLSLVTNDPARRLVSVTLSGAGAGPLGPAIGSEPAAFNFGSVKVGESRSDTLFPRNVGSAELTITSVSSSAPAITVTPTSPLPIKLVPYGILALAVKFTPAAAGPVSGVISVASTDPKQPVFSIAVRGEGITGTTSPCTFGVQPGVLAVGADGGRVSMTVLSGCAWTVAADPFITLVSGAAGSGSASVTLDVAPNPGPGSRTGSVTVQGLVVTVEQEAPPVTSAAFVPVVLSSSGLAGSFYTSELALTNRGTTDAIVELGYTAFLGEGSGTGLDVLPAGAQLVFPDALAYLASLGIPIPAAGGNRGGTITVRATGVSSPGAVAATVRTTTAVPEGRAGLSYPAVPQRLTRPVILCGLRQNASDRSNLALINSGGATDGNVILRPTVFSGDPARPFSKALPDVPLAPGAFAQITGVLGSNGLSLPAGYVRVERVGGTAPFYAYAVINDQVTSDGSFIPPFEEDALAGKAGLTVPVIVETATFSSELVATNSAETPRTLRFSLVADAVTTADKTAAFTLTLAAGEQRVIPSLVQYLRELRVAGIGAAGPTYAGSLFAAADGGDAQGIVLGVRTSAAAANGKGRFGLFYTGVPTGGAASTSAWVYDLQQNGENRSNLAIVNTGEVDGGGAAYRIEIYDGDTRRLVKTLETSLPARRFVQFSGILTNAPGTTNGYARVVKTGGNNPFLTYGVINDGGVPGIRSDDGAFVAMEIGD